MAKRLREEVDQFHTTHYLECPRCHQHNIVSHGESRYVCLNCGWERDVANRWGDGPPSFLVFLALGFLIFMLMAQA